MRFGIAATLLLFVATSSFAQSSGSNEQAAPTTGFMASIGLDGSFDDSGHVMDLGTSAGYKFSRHVQFDVGVPFYFLSSSSGTASGVGNSALALRFLFPGAAVNYATSVTTFVPTGDAALGLSTGRATFDWSNHLDHDFGRITPSVDFGLANTLVDSKQFLRPFTTLGANAHLSGGASFDLFKSLSLQASAYEVLPWGQQKMYSRRIAAGGTGNPNPSHGRAYEQNHVTIAGADLTRDNGLSAGLDVTPAPCVDVYGGYTRSLKFALNEFDFGFGVDVGRAMRNGGCKKK